jgi:hypothetical protein
MQKLSRRRRLCVSLDAERSRLSPSQDELSGKISVARVSGFGKKMPTDRRLKMRSHISAVWASPYPLGKTWRPSRENLETGRDQTPSPLCRSGAQFRCIFSRFGSVSVRFYAIKCRLICEFGPTPVCGRAGSIRLPSALRNACLAQAFDHALVSRIEGRIVASVRGDGAAVPLTQRHHDIMTS